MSQFTQVRGNSQIKELSITNSKIVDATIELAKLAEGAELIKRDGSVAFTGNVDLGSNKITNVADGVDSNDVVNKGQLDAESVARAAADSALDARMTTAEADIDAVEARMTTAEADIDALEVAVADEATARAAADTTLQANIDAEASARASADTTLQANINAEATARADADDALDIRVSNLEDGLSAETIARQSADTTLQANIDAEASARASADTTLQANIDAEEARALAAEGVLQANIDAEASARASADTTLQANIDAEASARASADTTLQANIDAEEARALAAEGVLQDNIDAEEARALAAEGVLQDNIDAEEARALAAEGVLQGNIDAEASARASADTTLKANIDAEESARIAGDASTLASAQSYTDAAISNLIDGAPELLDTLNELAAAIGDDENFVTTITNQIAVVQAAVDAEEARALAAEATLQANIDAEASARASADTTLQANIDAEASARASADSALQAEIDAEEARALAAEATLQANIDAEESARIAGDADLQAQLDEATSGAFISREVPTGAVDGVNATFTLANTPNPDSEQVFLNGVLQNVGAENDYTISGSTITFNVAPESESVILANYISNAIIVGSGGSDFSSVGINDLTDVTITSATSGQVLQYDGSGWINGEAPSTFSGSYNDLTDKPDLSIYATEADMTTAEADIVALQSADSTLQSNIDAEASARASADTTLQANIDAEASARTSADSTLQSNIDAEASARASADTTLQANIDAEESARIAGDASTLASAQSYTDAAVANVDLSSVESRLTTLEDDAFITREVPSGSIDGSNTSFVLANTPVSGSEQVFLNGMLQHEGAGNDYTISGSTITFGTAPETGWKLHVSYATGSYLVAPAGSGSSYSDADVSSFLNGNIDGHLIPDTNVAYDLGTAEKKFRDLYLSSGTIHLGDATISSTGSDVTVGGVDLSALNGRVSTLEAAEPSGSQIFTSDIISVPNTGGDSIYQDRLITTITHNLNKKPEIQVYIDETNVATNLHYDAPGVVIPQAVGKGKLLRTDWISEVAYGYSVRHLNDNQIEVRFHFLFAVGASTMTKVRVKCS